MVVRQNARSKMGFLVQLKVVNAIPYVEMASRILMKFVMMEIESMKMVALQTVQLRMDFNVFFNLGSNVDH